MIVADRADRVEPREVIFVWRVIAMPGDDVEGRMTELGRPQMALEFGDQLAGPVAILETGAGRQEIARIGEAVGADRPQFRQPELRAVILAGITAGPSVGQF